jgi:hypothetical protein
MLRNGGERHMGADSHAAVVFWPTWRRDACAPSSAGFSDEICKNESFCLSGLPAGHPRQTQGNKQSNKP